MRGDLRPEFGAQAAGHRAAIRDALAAQLGEAEPSLKDLNVRPASPKWSISISHTTDLGGWVAVPRGHDLGFDLEVRARVREAVIRRVCTPAEVALTDDLAALWSAKEALFKASARGRTATLAQLRIVSWRTDGALSRFEGENGARGAVQNADGFAAAWSLK